MIVVSKVRKPRRTLLLCLSTMALASCQTVPVAPPSPAEAPAPPAPLDLKAALEACERYYQAFQFVVWAGKESKEALASTMFETEGRA